MSTIHFEEEEFETQFNGRTVLRILSQAKPHWHYLVAFLITISLVALIDSIFTYITKLIVDDAIIGENSQALIEYLTVYGMLIILQAAAVFGFIYFTGILGELIRYDMRKTMFNHLQRLSFSYFDRTPVGWIMSRVTSDTERIAELVTWGLLDVTWAVMSISIAVIFMLAINWKIGAPSSALYREKQPVFFSNGSLRLLRAAYIVVLPAICWPLSASSSC